MTPIKMTYCPDKDVAELAVGEWKWFEVEGIDRAGIVVHLPGTGDWMDGLTFLPRRGVKQQGASWDFTGDEHTGLTLTPSIWHNKGGPGDWHGYITNGELRQC